MHAVADYCSSVFLYSYASRVLPVWFCQILQIFCGYSSFHLSPNSTREQRKIRCLELDSNSSGIWTAALYPFIAIESTIDRQPGAVRGGGGRSQGVKARERERGFAPPIFPRSLAFASPPPASPHLPSPPNCALYQFNGFIVSTLQALSHVYSWRGKSNITVGKLLIDLWRKDEMSLGVARTPQWLIKGDKNGL
jgi:hypothetical protein